MSLDISLKGKSSLERHRNVLKRSERVAVLEDNDKWTEEKSSVFGLVKVGHRKAVAAKKAPKAAEAGGLHHHRLRPSVHAEYRHQCTRG